MRPNKRCWSEALLACTDFDKLECPAILAKKADHLGDDDPGSTDRYRDFK